MAPSPMRQMRSLLCGRAFAVVVVVVAVAVCGGGAGGAGADMMDRYLLGPELDLT